MTKNSLFAEVLHNLSLVVTEEEQLKRVAQYLRRVIAEKQNEENNLQ